MTLEQIEKKYRVAKEKADALAEERNRAVVEAVRSGRKPAEVAREIGVTRGRVWQILERSDT